MFKLDPHVKRECVWHGPTYRKAAALVDRRNNFVWLSTTRDEEPVMLTQHLSDTDSMLAGVADPQRAPEMLAAARFAAAVLRSLSHRPRIAHENNADWNVHPGPSSRREAILQPFLRDHSSRLGQMKHWGKQDRGRLPRKPPLCRRTNGRFDKVAADGIAAPSIRSRIVGTLRYLLWTAAQLRVHRNSWCPMNLKPAHPTLPALAVPFDAVHPKK